MQYCILIMVPNINYTIEKGYYVTANEVYAYTKYFIEKNSLVRNKVHNNSEGETYNLKANEAYAYVQ
ncbi:hypothetical protein [Bacillus cereus]|uniref:hypothetical protein n=1 Tax=Bacillus cereus TaxID=1396 RepID=UPI001155549A|nr:hypothetical protein [Bacillus cereus]